MNSTVYERKAYQRELDKLQVPIKRITIVKCKPIFTFHRSSIVSEGRNSRPFQRQTTLILSRNIPRSMLYVVNLCRFITYKSLSHRTRLRQQYLFSCRNVCIHGCAWNNIAYNINPYRISGVIFKQTKFHETDYWRNTENLFKIIRNMKTFNFHCWVLIRSCYNRGKQVMKFLGLFSGANEIYPCALRYTI